MAFLQILSAILPVFLIVGIGYAIRSLKIISDDAEKSILRLVVNLLYPCFILSKVPGNQSLQDVPLVATAITAGFGLTVTAFGVAYLVGWLFRIKTDEGRNTFCLSAGLQNYGFLPIPLIVALFPNSADSTLGILFVHNLGLELALWTIGIVLLSGTMEGAFRRLINGPTIAIGVGLLSNFTGLHLSTPEFLAKATTELGNCSIPMGLILVGSALSGVMATEKWQLSWRVAVGASLVRFVAMPFVLLSAAMMVASIELKRVLIVEAAMPAAIFPVVLAKYYGGKPNIAVQVIMTTSVLSLIATPTILMFALDWFQLKT